MKPKVSIAKGRDRRENIIKSLEGIADNILNRIGGRRIIIKPNFVTTSVQLGATHVDQVRGILDFFRETFSGKILIAEGSAGDTWDGFKHFGYDQLPKEYNVELVDLNSGPFDWITLGDSGGMPFKVRVSSLLLKEDIYLISAAMLKTHDAVVVTLSIKNAAMGSVFRPDKMKVHQGMNQTNRNIAVLAQHVWPDLSVIDGLTGMEGNGPIHGEPIHVGIALSGADPMAVDRIACEVMAVDYKKVGYLVYCSQKRLGEANLERILVTGAPLKECITPFRLHEGVEKQYQWQSLGINELVDDFTLEEHVLDPMRRIG